MVVHNILTQPQPFVGCGEYVIQILLFLYFKFQIPTCIKDQTTLDRTSLGYKLLEEYQVSKAPVCQE